MLCVGAPGNSHFREVALGARSVERSNRNVLQLRQDCEHRTTVQLTRKLNL